MTSPAFPTLLADVAPPRDSGSSGHVLLTVVGFVLAVAVVVVVYAVVTRRRR